MAMWDVFRSDRLEVERSLTTEAIRDALARGDLRDDDMIRPAGTTVPWARLADLPALLAPEPEAEPNEPAPETRAAEPPEASKPEAETDDFGPPEFPEILDDEEAAEFTLSHDGPQKVEELDLAAMVDVALQMVLFFLVTAMTVLYKTLEVPKPSPERPAAGAAQGRSRTSTT